MNELDGVIPIAALIPAIWMAWSLLKSLVSAKERTETIRHLKADPVFVALCTGLVLSVIGFLVWIGTLGAVPFGKSVWGIAAFGLAALVWHQAYSRKRPPSAHF